MTRRCLVEGCGKWVKVGKAVCEGHAKTPFGRVIRDELRGLERDLQQMADAGGDEASRRTAVREFRRRVEQGEYAALYAGRLREAMGEATREPGFGEGREVLRAALWRLMSDEDVDVVRLAHAVSRLVGAPVILHTTRDAQSLGFAGPAVLVASFATRFGLGIDTPWYLLSLVSAGYVPWTAGALGLVWLAVAGQLTAAAAGRYAPYDPALAWSPRRRSVRAAPDEERDALEG